MSIRWQSYAALGDSLSEGLEDPYPDGSMRGWTDRLAAHLAARHGEPIRFANFAIRGRLLTEILDEQVEPALALKPELVSLWGGGNDIMRPKVDVPDLLGRLDEAVARFRAAGSDVLLGTTMDSKGSPILEMTRPRAMELNLGVWQIARRHGAFVADTWSLTCLRDWRMWFEDRLHLSGEGHERVAQAALVALGLDPDRPDWDAPLAARPPMTRRDRLEWNYVWARDYLRPWLGRRIRGTSSGDGRGPKYPDWVLVSATGRVAGTAE